jgi:hypothetical protein
MSKRLLEVFQALRFQLILQQLSVSGIISQQAIGHVRFQQGSKDRQKMLRGTRGTLGEGILSCARLGGRLGLVRDDIGDFQKGRTIGSL